MIGRDEDVKKRPIRLFVGGRWLPPGVVGPRHNHEINIHRRGASVASFPFTIHGSTPGETSVPAWYPVRMAMTRYIDVSRPAGGRLAIFQWEALQGHA